MEQLYLIRKSESKMIKNFETFIIIAGVYILAQYCGAFV
jgi:hypothetical protein